MSWNWFLNSTEQHSAAADGNCQLMAVLGKCFSSIIPKSPQISCKEKPDEKKGFRTLINLHETPGFFPGWVRKLLLRKY